jgi:thymidylate synthase
VLRSPAEGIALVAIPRRPAVERPSVDDPVVAELGDPEWLAWMHENFSVEKEVPELGGADSYAVRLFNYAHTGRDQVAWVVEQLRASWSS